jgi:hypothetical protein
MNSHIRYLNLIFDDYHFFNHIFYYDRFQFCLLIKGIEMRVRVSVRKHHKSGTQQLLNCVSNPCLSSTDHVTHTVFYFSIFHYLLKRVFLLSFHQFIWHFHFLSPPTLSLFLFVFLCNTIFEIVLFYFNLNLFYSFSNIL